ncbi:protein insensitive-like [Drosophila busckii]|nr:protein insensitive-like [Drosophila busckii]
MQFRLQELQSILNASASKEVEVEMIEHSVVEKIGIGPNKTNVDRMCFKKIKWDCYSLATRALLDAVFDKQTLATKTLSGIKKRSKSRIRSKELELDPVKVNDIVQLVKQKCNVDEWSIRRIISIKCSDTANTKRFNPQPSEC